jgi:hypothetical protein
VRRQDERQAIDAVPHHFDRSLVRRALMTLELKAACERCMASLPPDSADARICSYECTFCAACAGAMHGRCPNCGGELVARPRRLAKSADVSTIP